MNLWYAAVAATASAGRCRLTRELAQLRQLGVQVVRIMALSEGPDSEPYRVVPSLQPEPRRVSTGGIEALDWLFAELHRHGLVAVVTLTNFWFWSGGLTQYLAWAGAAERPCPLEPGGDWDEYQDFAASFFDTPAAQDIFLHTARAVVSRYAQHPAVFAWELINEPRGRRYRSQFVRWLDRTAQAIKDVAPNQLVTTGSEGDTPWPQGNGLNTLEDHSSSAIDFVSFHVWPENWGWLQPTELPGAVPSFWAKAEAYIRSQTQQATRLNKPAFLLETGLSRDGRHFGAPSSTLGRDEYLRRVLSLLQESVQSCGALAGVSPWSWCGEARPERPGEIASQTTWLGDPPHERQGWYSIYDTDASTLRVLRNAGDALLQASPPAQCMGKKRVGKK